MAYLYTILFSNGLIKVGMTASDPEKRITTHAAALSVAQIDVKDYEFIECDSDCVQESERSLINRCKEASPTAQKSKEWFYGLEFDSVTQWMRNVASCTKPQQKAKAKTDGLSVLSDLRADAMEIVKAAFYLAK